MVPNISVELVAESAQEKLVTMSKSVRISSASAVR